jgi:hypothetical protein
MTQLQRIHLDSPRPGANGHDAKFRVEGPGAGLVREAMLHSLQGRGLLWVHTPNTAALAHYGPHGSL